MSTHLYHTTLREAIKLIQEHYATGEGDGYSGVEECIANLYYHYKNEMTLILVVEYDSKPVFVGTNTFMVWFPTEDYVQDIVVRTLLSAASIVRL